MQNDLPRAVGVIDDDPAVLDSFRFMLEVAGYRVLTFRSALDFLAHTANLPCCLILDQQMPDLTGLELVERLRSDGIVLPILLVTAWPSPVLVARAAELGIEGVIEKPPNEGDILGFAAAYLGNARLT
jgi:two-component system response regulator FixJ